MGNTCLPAEKPGSKWNIGVGRQRELPLWLSLVELQVSIGVLPMGQEIPVSQLWEP